MIGTYWEDLSQKMAELNEALAYDQRTPEWGHLQHLARPADDGARVFAAAARACGEAARSAHATGDTMARIGSPLRINGYPEAKRAERRAKNKAARKARRNR